MKAFRYVILALLAIGLIYWTVTIINSQNERWAITNGNVGVLYWFIIPLVWLKVSAFLIYGMSYQLIKIKGSETVVVHQFKNFKLFSISNRLIAAFVDLILVTLIWLGLISCLALALIPFYNNGLVNYSYPASNSYLACFNYLLDRGWYIFIITYFLYYVLLEFSLSSTPGKMLNNCWLISSGLKRPNFFQVLLKNTIRFLPINEFTCYFKWISLNEYTSGIRTIQLDKTTESAYNELIKK